MEKYNLCGWPTNQEQKWNKNQKLNLLQFIIDFGRLWGNGYIAMTRFLELGSDITSRTDVMVISPWLGFLN
jgi:hypothetical protein